LKNFFNIHSLLVFDDSRGDYKLVIHDHIHYRYEILSLLGKGSFGQVVKCFDHKLKSEVAVKIIRNKKRFEKQGTIEVRVLDLLRKRINDQDNTNSLVKMLEYFYFRGHLCITFELLGKNLYDWLKAGNFKGIHLGIIRTFSIQILQCLQILKRERIVHCDLKPEVCYMIFILCPKKIIIKNEVCQLSFLNFAVYSSLSHVIRNDLFIITHRTFFLVILFSLNLVRRIRIQISYPIPIYVQVLIPIHLHLAISVILHIEFLVTMLKSLILDLHVFNLRNYIPMFNQDFIEAQKSFLEWIMV